MQVNSSTLNINNRNQNYMSAKQLAFAGKPPLKSKLFNPIAKQYDKLADKIAHNYYEAFYRSKFSKKFLEKAKNVDNMTTHMSAIGATLISGMYTVRTLQNDKLDPEKRKTLALNDVMTWAISTAGSYFLDSKLANWWDGVTTRFVSNYLLDNPGAKRLRTLGDWDPANIYEMMGKKFTKDANDKNINEIIKEFEAEGYQVTKDAEKGKVSFLLSGRFVDAKNARIDQINKKINASDYHGLRKPLEFVKPDAFTNIRDFNLDVLKNKRLTTLIDGMGVLKSLFVFGMVYRYIVPVLVMKPANKLGAYLHKKNAEKEQQQNTKKA